MCPSCKETCRAKPQRERLDLNAINPTRTVGEVNSYGIWDPNFTCPSYPINLLPSPRTTGALRNRRRRQEIAKKDLGSLQDLACVKSQLPQQVQGFR